MRARAAAFGIFEGKLDQPFRMKQAKGEHARLIELFHADCGFHHLAAKPGELALKVVDSRHPQGEPQLHRDAPLAPSRPAGARRPDFPCRPRPAG
jgi:hypothetical protein